MSRYTYFDTEIQLNRILPNDISDKLSETNEYITDLTNQLYMLGSMSPIQQYDENNYPIEWIEYIRLKIKNILTELEEYTILRFKLELALENKDNLTYSD